MSERASITDSGERRTFGSGAVRDRGTLKPRPDLISPHANTAEGWVLAEGAVKYDARNWEKGIPISECLASTMRHLEAFKLGQQDEPHLAQARTNIGFILHYLGEIEAGRMDPAIDDMPKYEDRPRRFGGFKIEHVAERTPLQTWFDSVAESLQAWHDRHVRESGLAADEREVGGINPSLPVKWENRIEEPPETFPEMVCRRVKEAQEGWQKWAKDSGQAKPITGGSEIVGLCADCGNALLPDGTCEHDLHATHKPPRPTVYIAGPMRGIPLYNFPAFDAARDQWAQCYNVISPADLDRANGFDPLAGDTADDFTADQMSEVIRRDLDAILTFNPADGDGIAVLPGWEASRGANVEVALARFLGLHIWDAITGAPVEIG